MNVFVVVVCFVFIFYSVSAGEKTLVDKSMRDFTSICGFSLDDKGKQQLTDFPPCHKATAHVVTGRLPDWKHAHILLTSKHTRALWLKRIGKYINSTPLASDVTLWFTKWGKKKKRKTNWAQHNKGNFHYFPTVLCDGKHVPDISQSCTLHRAGGKKTRKKKTVICDLCSNLWRYLMTVQCRLIIELVWL